MLFLFFLLFSSQTLASFSQWKKEYSKKAKKRGVPAAFSWNILANLQFDPRVVKRDRNQVLSDRKKNYKTFMKKWMSSNPSRIEKAKRKLQENLPLLQKIEAKYGVDKEIIVSLWGVETSFGTITGQYDVIRSLATLAFEGRRRTFFEAQLDAALLMLYKGHVSRNLFKGSWAGATGQCQFMPDSHQRLAQDFDKDGIKDIWGNKGDIFASIANYLKKSGWKKGKKIGSLVKNIHKKKLKEASIKSQMELYKLGYRNLDGSKISDPSWKRRKLVPLTMIDAPAILKDKNFEAI